MMSGDEDQKRDARPDNPDTPTVCVRGVRGRSLRQSRT